MTVGGVDIAIQATVTSYNIENIDVDVRNIFRK